VPETQLCPGTEQLVFITILPHYPNNALQFDLATALTTANYCNEFIHKTFHGKILNLMNAIHMQQSSAGNVRTYNMFKTISRTYEENSCFQKLLQSTVVPGIIPAFRNK